jgi:hypothetical protein
MLRAQVRQVFEPAHILIEQPVARTPLNDALRRQRLDVLPADAEVRRLLVATDQHRTVRRPVASLRPIVCRHRCGHRSILRTNPVGSAADRTSIVSAESERADTVKGRRRASPAGCTLPKVT